MDGAKITVRLADTEAELIKIAACNSGLAQNEWLRRALLSAAGSKSGTASDRQAINLNLIYTKVILDAVFSQLFTHEKRHSEFPALWNAAAASLRKRGIVNFKELPVPRNEGGMFPPGMFSKIDHHQGDDIDDLMQTASRKKAEKKDDINSGPTQQPGHENLDPATLQYLHQLNQGRGR